MSKRRNKRKEMLNMAYAELRVYKDGRRPVVFEDKRKKEKYNWKTIAKREGEV